MKKYIIPFIIGLILIGVGSCYLSFELLSFEEAVYQEKQMEEVTEKFSYSLENNTTYNINKNSDYQKILVTIDDTINNEIVVIVTYDKYLGTLSPSRYLNGPSSSDKNTYNLHFNVNYDNKINPIKKGLSILKDMIKKKVFYNNIESIYTPKIEVRISNINKHLLMINGNSFTNINVD